MSAYRTLTHRSWCLQVNRAFRDVILASPLIQHKIDLFAAGLEYNTIAKIDLDESRKALLRFKSGMDSLCPIEERAVDDPLWSYGCSIKTVGGIHAVIGGGSAQLFALGFASRGIPYKQWEIPLPTVGRSVMAFVLAQMYLRLSNCNTQ